MFDLRRSGIIAAAAFFLSFLIGLISKSSMPFLLIKPLIFAAVFFFISSFIGIIVSKFLPELLEEESDFSPGSKINIMESDSGVSQSTPGQIFSGALPDSSEDGLGNISDLASKASSSAQTREGISPGMDQNAEDDYTESESADTSRGSWGGSGESADFGGEVLPDFDSMAGAFITGSSDEEKETKDYSTPAPVRKPLSGGGKAPSWAGDFNAKEIAMGLRTVLSKDKEG